jgi:hypothetical protein
MGFGLAIGYAAVFSTANLPDSFEDGCRSPVEGAYGIVLLPIVSISMGIVINAGELSVRHPVS